MHEEIVIKKEELDIDDTKIKLELDEDEGATQPELTSAGSFMKIIEEQPNMITVPVHDYESEDELKFIASLSTFDQQQKLFVTSACENDLAAFGAFECKICRFRCENHLALASHQINHQLNRHFCCHGCGAWHNTLEEILEHEYRQHAGGLNASSCRICHLECTDAASLSRHQASHFYVRRFVCAICRRHFETRQGLQLHRQHSKEPCGQVDYADMASNVGQLVAVSKLDTELPTDLFCDVPIKSEPMDTEEQLQQPQMTDIVIKTESQSDGDDLRVGQDASWISSNSLAGQLRGKLRLPAIKRPLKEEPAKQIETSAPVHPTIQFVPAGKWKPIPMPNTAGSSIKLPNILKPNKGNNKAISIVKNNILQSTKSKPNIAANVLKVLPSNCMLIKLPPNTKIIKLAPSAPSVNSNSSTIGSKIIKLPSSMTITSGPLPTATTNSTFATGSILSPARTTQAATPKMPINRNAYFSALSMFESLPESRKIITDFQNQIRSIEQSLPLPGSVLQTPKKCSKVLVPSQLQALRLPPTKESNEKVRKLRYTYPDLRFHWECLKCARCYEQYSPFCNHMKLVHGIAEDQFDQMVVEVKTYRKSNSSSVVSSATSPAASAAEATAPSPAPVAAASLAPIPVIPAAEQSKAADAVPTPELPAVAAAPAVVAPAKPDPAAPPAPALVTANATAGAAAAKTTRPASIARPAQYRCDDCSKCFTTVGALRIHKMIHTGELPHKCNFCEKRFRTPGQVRVHQRRHTGEKPFKCKVCSLDFTHRETLISHLSRHIGMKRYKCYGCDKNFVVVSGLRAHRRLRPDTCGKVKFTARAHGPRVRVIRGEVVFESHPEHNGYLRSEDPLNIMSEMSQATKEPPVASDSD